MKLAISDMFLCDLLLHFQQPSSLDCWLFQLIFLSGCLQYLSLDVLLLLLKLFSISVVVFTSIIPPSGFMLEFGTKSLS